MTATSVQGATPRLSSTKIHCLLNDQGLFEQIGLKENSSDAHSHSRAHKHGSNKSEIGAKPAGQLSSRCGTAIEIPARSKKSGAYSLLDAGKRLCSLAGA
jgi:hypothetical protein